MGILKKFSIRAPAGATTAFVGPSGGGKSTIFALILRFYDPLKGKVTIDGHDVKEMDSQWLHRHIGLVPQDTTLFGRSVKDNLCYGRQTGECSEQEMTTALEKANARKFVDAFPDGLETMVGERGVRLSGGQRQRIAIARALLLNPAVLLLDEATSALDSETEHIVQEAFEVLLKGRTVLVIAHRLSTVRKAEQIVVVENRTVAGTIKADMTCPAYQTLVQRQLNKVHIVETA